MEINLGGRNSNEVDDEIIETCGVNNREGRNSSEVREIDEVNNGVTVEMPKDIEVLPRKKQITITSMVTSIILSIFFNLIVCKLSLTLGRCSAKTHPFPKAHILQFAFAAMTTFHDKLCTMLQVSGAAMNFLSRFKIFLL
jgi:hypothetical protein